MSSYQLLLFDLDGTLIDSEGDIVSATNHTLRSLGYPTLQASEIRAFVGSGVVQLLGDSVANKHGRAPSAAELKQGEKVFFDYYFEHCLDETRFYPEVLETLEKLKKNYRLGILTNKPKIFTDKIIDGLGATPLFWKLLSANEGFPKKPDPMGANSLIQEAKCKPSDTLMVGDSVFDVAVAQNAHMDSALVTYGFSTPEELKDLTPTYRIDSFGDLTRYL